MSGCGAREANTSVRVAGIEVPEIADMVGEHRATNARTGVLNTGRVCGLAVHPRIEECAVDDELTPPVGQVQEAHRPFRPLEGVLPVHGDPGASANAPQQARRAPGSCPFL